MRVLNCVGRLVVVGCLSSAVAIVGVPDAHLAIPADATVDDCVIRPVSAPSGAVDEGTTLDPAAVLVAEQDFHQRSAPQLAAFQNSAATINVLVHVISRDNTVAGGNVPDSQIQHQVNALNEGFRETGLQFRLVGIDRTVNPAWFDYGKLDAEQRLSMKRALRKGSAADLNLYTVNLHTADGPAKFGWSTFPSSYQQNPADDGVVVAADTLAGGSFAPHNLGINVVHEVGHWVGLYDTSQGGCASPGDYVDDTPAESSPSFGCHPGRDTCPAPGLDPVNNYMDDSDDSCRTQFTPGQIARMRSQLAHYRGISA